MIRRQHRHVTSAPSDGDDSEKLLKNADMALYRAKSDGRGTYRFFEAAMDEKMQIRRRSGDRPARARCRCASSALIYQPLVDLQSRAHHRLRGAGALAASRARHGLAGRIHSGRRGDRPDHADRRMGAAHAPAARPRAGRTTSASRSTCRRCSSRSRNLVTTVMSALATSRPAPRRLELEITETLLLRRRAASAGDAARAARARRADLDGRFRHRLFVA